MVSSGFAEEFVGVDLKDKRLNKRLLKIADSLGKACHSSIPAAADGRAEMEAIYRFFDNPKVTPAILTSAHRCATLERIGQCDVVLLIQDTTEVDVTRPSEQVKGAGPLTHDSRRGSFYHPLVAFTAEGLALGTVWSKCWARKAIHTDRTAAEKRATIRARPIEEKESIRWLEGLRAGLEVASECRHTQCIVIGDRESDIYEFLAEPRTTEDGARVEILIRATQDRNIEDPESKLLSRVRSTPCRFTRTLHISKRTQKINVKNQRKSTRSRDARLAEVAIRAATVTIMSPRNGPQRPSLTYNVVLVEEISPPKGEEPIQWLLITSLPIDTDEDLERILGYYCHRWHIEIYFRTLKSGCRIQERYFETMPRLENCLAMYIVIAWKIMYLCQLGRDCPDMPCSVIFSDSEWKAVYRIVKRKPAPETPPTLNEFIRLIASLGGYVNRKSTSPGTQTLWLGLQRVFDFAKAWDTFGPECPPPK